MGAAGCVEPLQQNTGQFRGPADWAEVCGVQGPVPWVGSSIWNLSSSNNTGEIVEWPYGQRGHNPSPSLIIPSGASVKSGAMSSANKASSRVPQAIKVWGLSTEATLGGAFPCQAAGSTGRHARHPLHSNGGNAAKMAVRERNTSLVIISNQKSPPLLQAPSFQPYSNKVTPF